jgi:dual specificity MAP kinase phosphatase
MNCISCDKESVIIHNGLGWCKGCYDYTVKQFEEFEKNKIYIPTRPIHIIDNLYIGDVCSSIDENILNELNIKHIVVAGRAIQKKSFSNINYLKLEINDSLEQDLKPYFGLSNNFIKDGLTDSSVLVHCYSGISRSSSIIISYLMKEKNMDYDSAYLLVKSKSSRICPNSNFENQLRNNI